jgi:hypothetical protein
MIRATNQTRLIMGPPNTMECLRHYQGRFSWMEGNSVLRSQTESLCRDLSLVTPPLTSWQLRTP